MTCVLCHSSATPQMYVCGSQRILQEAQHASSFDAKHNRADTQRIFQNGQILQTISSSCHHPEASCLAGYSRDLKPPPHNACSLGLNTRQSAALPKNAIHLPESLFHLPCIHIVVACIC